MIFKLKTRYYLDKYKIENLLSFLSQENNEIMDNIRCIYK